MEVGAKPSLMESDRLGALSVQNCEDILKEMKETQKILSDMRARRKKIHPLKQPYREAPNGKAICRFWNYNGNCMKGDECLLDHNLCHICIGSNHNALKCPYFIDEKEFKKFSKTFTLLNTRPASFQRKTVLGDAVQWDSERLPIECRADDGQLRRCRRHKR